MAKTIYAFDLGTNCGWAKNVGTSIIYGHLDLKPRRHESAGMRFVNFERSLWEMIPTFGKVGQGLVVYEEVARHAGTHAAHVYGGLLAILQKFCVDHSTNYKGYPVGTIKKHATGKGNANKDMMRDAACRILHESNKVPVPSITYDESDAVCLLSLAMSESGG